MAIPIRFQHLYARLEERGLEQAVGYTPAQHAGQDAHGVVGGAAGGAQRDASRSGKTASTRQEQAARPKACREPSRERSQQRRRAGPGSNRQGRVEHRQLPVVGEQQRRADQQTGEAHLVEKDADYPLTKSR